MMSKSASETPDLALEKKKIVASISPSEVGPFARRELSCFSRWWLEVYPLTHHH